MKPLRSFGEKIFLICYHKFWEQLVSKASNPSNSVSTITRARTQYWFLQWKMRTFSSKMLIFYLIVGVLYWFHTCWALFWGLKLALSLWTKRTPLGTQASNLTLVSKELKWKGFVPIPLELYLETMNAYFEGPFMPEHLCQGRI